MARKLCGMLLLSLLGAHQASAEVFHSKESALKLAFPSAERIESRTLFLTEAQKRQAEAKSGGTLDSRMITYYVGLRGQRVLGYAFIDSHLVRTLPETALIVLGPDGRVQTTHLLAFHEPSEYMAPKRWLRQFDHKQLDSSLRLGGDVVAIAGSSLTSSAMTACIRRTLALFEMFLHSRTASAVESSPKTGG